MKLDKVLDQVEARLQTALPGLESQEQMAPLHRPDLEKKFRFKDPPRVSSVLLLMFLKNEKLHIPAIVRADNGGVHGGQIAFPGGRIEAQDKNLKETAIRETIEEIGIDAGSARFLGNLSDLFIAVSNNKVRPYVAYTSASVLEYRPDGTEVADVIEINIEDYLFGKNRMEGVVQTNRGFRIKTPYFPLQGHQLWGASAMIFSEFLSIMDEVYANPG